MSQITSSAVTSSRFSALSVWFTTILLALTLARTTNAAADLKLLERWPIDRNACIDADLRLTFDRPPVLGSAGKIELCRASDGQPVETISLNEQGSVDHFRAGRDGVLVYPSVRIDGPIASIRLHPGSLAYGESYFVRIEPSVFDDFTGISEPWKFSIKPALPRNPSRLVVSKDGSGDFCTVQGAVNQIEPHRTEPATIFIRKGRYEELVRIGRERRHIHLVGEDRKGTVIAYANNEKLNPGWIGRTVVGVEADDFVLENLTVQNTTPYKGSQAEAILVNAEHCVLRNADLLSFQDTLNLSGRVYVADCYIEGDVDYVWGYGSACLERCELRTMHDGYIVQARNPPGRFGYVFIECKFTAASEVKKCWLARIETARFPASHVAFIRCAMGPHILPVGWQITGPPSAQLRFEEFASTDLEGKPLDIGQRHPASKQIPAEQVPSCKSVLNEQ